LRRLKETGKKAAKASPRNRGHGLGGFHFLGAGLKTRQKRVL